ncbi:Kunitz/Bovine pancreatic trypsin inhibitor domain protein [Ancylostoma duodenale]|uniref:Kunitz/Bovine pancreatic trypsin inhibitor domain protein n=1 Tax=Ancylostoma duodenale TaxID=51022 RepID=A0A0C2FPL6_9BILA|nr:Kunitz/Bovine pancreatic trypsin inhibitor domain protein [Ancylostoma duodenale]
MKFLVFFFLCLIFGKELDRSFSMFAKENVVLLVAHTSNYLRHRIKIFSKFGYDPATGQCVRFRWGGCEANGNNFESMNECWITCVRGQQHGKFPPMQQQQVQVPPMSQKHVKLPRM